MDQNLPNIQNPSTYSNVHLNVSIMTGLVAGIIIGIPYINLINCCFLGYLGAGFIAVYLFNKRSNVLRLSDSLVIGVITGFVIGLVSKIIDIILYLLGFNQQVHFMEKMMAFFEKMDLPPEAAIEMNEKFNEAIEMAKNQTIGTIIKHGLTALIMSIIFTSVGSLIAGLIFKKQPEVITEDKEEKPENPE